MTSGMGACVSFLMVMMMADSVLVICERSCCECLCCLVCIARNTGIELDAGCCKRLARSSSDASGDEHFRSAVLQLWRKFSPTMLPSFSNG